MCTVVTKSDVHIWKMYVFAIFSHTLFNVCCAVVFEVARL